MKFVMGSVWWFTNFEDGCFDFYEVASSQKIYIDDILFFARSKILALIRFYEISNEQKNS